MSFKIDFQQLFGRAADVLFAKGLMGTTVFHGAVRPILHGHSDGDINKAQALALEGLHTYLHVVKSHSDQFLERFDGKVSFDALKVPVAGKMVLPVGTGAGLDPNADGLEPFSYLFGFQVPGPVSVEPRHLNDAPFLDDSSRGDLCIPADFSSRGLDYVVDKVRQYRDQGGRSVIMPCLVGLTSRDGFDDQPYRQMETMLKALAPYVDGFVWSPVLAHRVDMLTERQFARTAQLMASLAPKHLNLVEMPPFDNTDRAGWLGLVESFLGNGGMGLVAVYGLEVPKDQVPKPAKWPYDEGVLFGASLGPYRQRAIEAARQRFPKAFIAASGGFHGRDAAFEASEYANVIMESEAFTRYGPGLSRVLLKKLALRLKVLEKQGVASSTRLVDYQLSRWNDRE